MSLYLNMSSKFDLNVSFLSAVPGVEVHEESNYIPTLFSELYLVKRPCFGIIDSSCMCLHIYVCCSYTIGHLIAAKKLSEQHLKIKKTLIDVHVSAKRKI